MASELKLTKELANVYICKAIEKMPLAEFKVLHIIDNYANPDLKYILVHSQSINIYAYCIRYVNNQIYLFTINSIYVYVNYNLITTIEIPEYVCDSGQFDIVQIDNILHCRLPHWHNIKYVLIDIVANRVICIFDIRPHLVLDYIAHSEYFNRFNNYIALSFATYDDYMLLNHIHDTDNDNIYIKPADCQYIGSEAKTIDYIFGDDEIDESDVSDQSDQQIADDEDDQQIDNEQPYQQIADEQPNQQIAVEQPNQQQLDNDEDEEDESELEPYIEEIIRDIEPFKSIYYTFTHDVCSVHICKNILATISTNDNCYLYEIDTLNSNVVNNYMFSFPIIPLETIQHIDKMYIINNTIYIISYKNLYIYDMANHRHQTITMVRNIRDICVKPLGDILIITKHNIYEFKKM